MVDGAALLATMFCGHAAPPASGATASAASTSSTRARRGTTPTRRATASTSRSARSRPSSTPSCSSGSASTPTLAATQHDRARWPALRARFVDTLRAAHARRMVRGLRRLRRLLRAGALVRRIAPPSARRRRAPARSRSAASRSPRRRRASIARPARRRRPPPERGERRRAPPCSDWGFDAAAIDALRGLGVGFERGIRRRAVRAPSERGLWPGRQPARMSAHSPSDSAATPSSRSLSRWAVSERSAIGCRCGGTSA